LRRLKLWREKRLAEGALYKKEKCDKMIKETSKDYMTQANFKQKILLMLLMACSEKSMSPIQIMKGLFLFGQEEKPKDFYEFSPYLYGPCSLDVYRDLRMLKDIGIIISQPSNFNWDFYKIAQAGKEIIQDEKGLKKYKEKLEETKKFIISKTFIELLKFIYSKYPEFADNSIFNKETLKKL
jgi:hypothetical protein